jgi:undecaprenyl-diphosphatase
MVTLGWAIGVSIIIKPYTNKIKSVDSELPKNETTLLPEEEKLINEE